VAPSRFPSSLLRNWRRGGPGSRELAHVLQLASGDVRPRSGHDLSGTSVRKRFGRRSIIQFRTGCSRPQLPVTNILRRLRGSHSVRRGADEFNSHVRLVAHDVCVGAGGFPLVDILSCELFTIGGQGQRKRPCNRQRSRAGDPVSTWRGQTPAPSLVLTGLSRGGVFGKCWQVCLLHVFDVSQ